MHLTQVAIDQSRFPTKSAYPFNLPVLQQTESIDLANPVTIFSGENGTGKSTLLKAICMACGIHIWEGAPRPRYEINPHESLLHRVLDIRWADGAVPGSFFSPELFRNYTQLVDTWAVGDPGILTQYGGDSLVTQSHGQSCMAYFRSMYKNRGIYFLDEPEAALSPKTQLELLDVLKEMSADGNAQFIISTHSPILMAGGPDGIFCLDGSRIERIDLKETSHYKVYSRFLDAL